MKKEEKELTVKQPINPMIILAVIIIIASIATYVVPAGVFERIPNADTGYDIIAVDSFQYTDRNPIGIFDVFVSATLGLQNAAGIIFFLLIIGGTFQVVESTGALHAGLSNLVVMMKGKELLLVPVCTFVFALVSATAACCEEYNREFLCL